MTIKWPPKKAFEYDAKNPEKENGIVISAQPGGNPKKKRAEKTGEGLSLIHISEPTRPY